MKTTSFIATLLLTIVVPLCAVESGSQAPDFALTTLTGNTTVTLKQLRGKVVLLNFWASWCKGCKKEMPEFVALQKSYANDFRIVAVSLDGSPQKAKTFLRRLGAAPFTVLYDAKRTAAEAYGVQAMPSSYLIDKKGVVRDVIVGSLTHDDIDALRKHIDALRKE